MNSDKNDSAVGTLAAGFITVVIIIGLCWWGISSWLGSSTQQEDQSNKESNEKVVAKNTYETAVKLTLDEIKNTTADDFVKKYKDTWVTFDGVIMATSSNRDTGLTTGFVAGDSLSETNFDDVAMFRTKTEKGVFEESLSSYLKPTAPENVKDQPKVTITGLVRSYDAERSWVTLDANKDSTKPSVISR